MSTMVLPPVPAAWPVWTVAPPFVSLCASTPPPARWTVRRTAAGTSSPPGTGKKKYTHTFNLIIESLKADQSYRSMIIQLIIVLEFKKKKNCTNLSWMLRVVNRGGGHSAVLFSFSQFTFHKNQSLTIPVKSLSSLHPNAPLRQAHFSVFIFPVDKNSESTI